jgi:hypothetical protein
MLIFSQVFIQVIPSLISAFILCIIVLQRLGNFFEENYRVSIDKVPSLESSIQAVMIAIIIPILSSIIPIQVTLSKNLTDGLDLQRSKISGMFVNVLQKNKKDVRGLIAFGVISLMYGFGMYYLLPLSLVSFNLSLAFSIFMTIIFGMIYALALFFINIMPYINTIVIRLLLCLESASSRLMVYKSLIAHRERNQMTALIYSLTLGFIVFVSIVSKVPFMKEVSDEMMHNGADHVRIRTYNIPIFEVEQFLKKYSYAF